MAEINAQRAKSSDKSSAIFEHMKKRALEEIFTMMDSDSDGFISAHHIEISGIFLIMIERIFMRRSRDSGTTAV